MVAPRAKVRPKALSYKKKSELALVLIDLTHLRLEEGERLRVVTDLSYCCETVLKGWPREVRITGRVRKDSALYELPIAPIVRRQGRPRKKGLRLPIPHV